MSARLRHFIFFISCFLCYAPAYAQLTGTIAVPSGPYPDLKTAIDALNTGGVGTGGVTINITAPQYAPVGGYVLGNAVLNASVNAANTITINGNGNTVKSNVGTSTTVDGIFIIKGTDYITINGLNLVDTNTASTTTMMEWGYALVKLNATAPFDGSQHITINNCNINMALTSVSNTSINSTGIYVNNHIYSSNTLLIGTANTPTDAASYNTFSNDTIKANQGIYMNGMADVKNSPLAGSYDVGNVVLSSKITLGGTSLAAYGVYMAYDSTANVQNTTFRVTTGQTAVAYGINTTKTVGNINVSNDSFLMSSSGTTTALYAFNNGSGSDTSTHTAFTCNNNVITVSYPTATSGQCYGINNALSSSSSGYDTVTMNNNQILGINMPSGTGSVTAMSSSGYAHVINISNNIIANVTKSTGTFTAINGASYGKYGSTNITHNAISNITTTGASGTINGIVISSTVPFYNMYNTIKNISMSGSGSFNGGTVSTSNADGQMVENVAYDSIVNVSIATGTATGLSGNITTSLGQVHHNIISGFTATTGTLNGTSFIAGGHEMFDNNISNFTLTGASGKMYGINSPSATGANVQLYNNIISGFNAPAYSGNNIFGIYADGGALAKIYNNTIYLSFSSTGANLGAYGIYVHDGVINTTIYQYDIRNNIVNLNVLPAGTGIVSAINRDGHTLTNPPANISRSSDGNILYVPSVAHSYYYSEGTTRNNLVDTFNSTNDPAFNSACGLFKHFMNAYGSYTENNLVAGTLPNTFVPSGTSYAKGASVSTDGIVTTDYAGASRPATAADAGALQFTGVTPADMAPPVINYSVLPSPTCVAAPVLTATITDATGVNTTAGTAPRVYYKKASENDTFGVYPANNNSSFNGWKYVEGTSNGNTFTFTLDYSKLTAVPVGGDSVTYFVIAQDIAATPNVATMGSVFQSGYCLTSVNLTQVDSAAPAAGSKTINGYAVSTFDATITASGATTFCAGGSVDLTVNTDTNTNITYQWQRDGQNISATDTTYTASAGGSYTIFKSNGTCTITSAPVVVTIATPPAVITPLSDTAFCIGDSVVLKANTGTGLTYQWQLNGQPITPAATDTEYVAKTAGAYTLFVQSSNCANTSTPVTVIVNPLPLATLSISSGKATMCQGDTVVLSANAGTKLSYQWIADTTDILNATTINYATMSAGTYSVAVTDSNSCSATSATQTVQVNPLPAPAITQSGHDIFVTTTFSAYQWYNGTQPIAGATNILYHVVADGVYSVLVTDANGCKNMSDLDTLMVSAVSTVAGNKAMVHIYPNPASELVHIDAPANVSASILSMDGREILRVQDVKNINISTLPNAVYTVKVEDKNGVVIAVDKLIISR